MIHSLSCQWVRHASVTGLNTTRQQGRCAAVATTIVSLVAENHAIFWKAAIVFFVGGAAVPALLASGGRPNWINHVHLSIMFSWVVV